MPRGIPNNQKTVEDSRAEGKSCERQPAQDQASPAEGWFAATLNAVRYEVLAVHVPASAGMTLNALKVLYADGWRLITVDEGTAYLERPVNE